MHAAQTIADDTLSQLTEALDEPSVVELILVAGQYTMLSILATTTGPRDGAEFDLAGGRGRAPALNDLDWADHCSRNLFSSER